MGVRAIWFYILTISPFFKYSLLLLHKLHMYGIDPETCGWVRSFLCIRTRRVVVDGEASKEVENTSGVPHGSVLVPIFFLIHIKITWQSKPNTPQSDCCQQHHRIPHPDCRKWLQTAPRRPSSFGEVEGWLADGVPCWKMLCHQNNQEEDNP